MTKEKEEWQETFTGLEIKKEFLKEIKESSKMIKKDRSQIIWFILWSIVKKQLMKYSRKTIPIDTKLNKCTNNLQKEKNSWRTPEKDFTACYALWKDKTQFIQGKDLKCLDLDRILDTVKIFVI